MLMHGEDALPSWRASSRTAANASKVASNEDYSTAPQMPGGRDTAGWSPPPRGAPPSPWAPEEAATGTMSLVERSQQRQGPRSCGRRRRRRLPDPGMLPVVHVPASPPLAAVPPPTPPRSSLLLTLLPRPFLPSRQCYCGWRTIVDDNCLCPKRKAEGDLGSQLSNSKRVLRSVSHSAEHFPVLQILARSKRRTGRSAKFWAGKKSPKT